MKVRSDQAGVAMLEVLIALVVVSFGFLSLLKMQLTMLSNSSATGQNFLAFSLAHDMGERIRANKTGLLAYNGLKTDEFNVDCESTACTMAEEDFFQWKNSIAESSNALLNGEGEINASGGVATITLNWTERKLQQSSDAVSYTLQVSVE